jgi:hypothetical protein
LAAALEADVTTLFIFPGEDRTAISADAGENDSGENSTSPEIINVLLDWQCFGYTLLYGANKMESLCFVLQKG